jgi:hypothetical protein
VSAVVLYFQVTFLIVDEGKSVSLVYMLRRRCAERKPVIWYDGVESYIFVEDGVYEMAQDFHKNEFKIFVWTLVDSDQAPGGVPPELVRNRTRLFVLYASSPNVDRWKRLHKTVDDITVVMNPWTWREMLRACVFYTLHFHRTDDII